MSPKNQRFFGVGVSLRETPCTYGFRGVKTRPNTARETSSVLLQKMRHGVPPDKIPYKNKCYRGALLKRIPRRKPCFKKRRRMDAPGARRRPV